MKKFKILISDFDGTLANSQNGVSKENVDAINAFIARGGIFAVCTGRATDSIMKLLNEIGYKGLLASFNGAVLTDTVTGKELFRYGLDKAVSLRFFEYAVKHGIYSHYYPKNGFLYNQKTLYTTLYETLTKVKGKQVDIIEYIKNTDEKTPKILSFDDKETLDKHYDALVELMPECEVVRSNDNMYDLNIKGINKANACKCIADYFGADFDSDVVVIGDGGNDVPMLQACKNSFCTANGEEVAKLSAKYLAPSNDDNAVKYVIENYCI